MRYRSAAPLVRQSCAPGLNLPVPAFVAPPAGRAVTLERASRGLMWIGARAGLAEIVAGHHGGHHCSSRRTCVLMDEACQAISEIGLAVTCVGEHSLSTLFGPW